jgi:hypothetical protein
MCVSIAPLANNFDVMWVTTQVGHADSKMTTEVYKQLQQRARREHGEAFDAHRRASQLTKNGGSGGTRAIRWRWRWRRASDALFAQPALLSLRCMR